MQTVASLTHLRFYCFFSFLNLLFLYTDICLVEVTFVLECMDFSGKLFKVGA